MCPCNRAQTRSRHSSRSSLGPDDHEFFFDIGLERPDRDLPEQDLTLKLVEGLAYDAMQLLCAPPYLALPPIPPQKTIAPRPR